MRWGFERAGILAAVIGGLGAYCADARAQGAVEPSYGRIDGDVTVVVGAGGVVTPGGPRATGELRARYLETMGLFATYEDSLPVGSHADPRRLVAAGFELRPFFLYRWLRGLETHRARWDLSVDSFGLELGMTWPQPKGEPFAERPGVEFGLGIEVPIFPAASGPWFGLHGGIRWGDEVFASGVVRTGQDREAYLSITLAWHQVISAHLVDLGDRAPR
jgi:hypothetical protein